MNDISQIKQALRAEAVARRRAAHLAGQGQGGLRLRDVFTKHDSLAALVPPGLSVAAYWPMGDEIDPRPLMEWLHGRGCVVALPVVEARGQPLEFRLWRPGDLLEAGNHGTQHPSGAMPSVTPSLLLVPLLAFDRQGWRLGYGGGYYDRTIAALRDRDVPLRTVGIAYAAQEVEAVPVDGYDQRLDAVVTDETVILTTGIGG
ncbi:5-formyltetrahydrofolate cyclo-ligase [Telmatospirillum sp. J64-1]|uniref:5-formyltetrahydrofolate cyclo-ligase n=1 Tax=Telmatospirillum sp. J64-1 TaxID=2502183 RepID=UPI00115F1896|nr:5-formyltetrahydrofolate cyclo-ligase [Telmatospirillum sp. J64-1]